MLRRLCLYRNGVFSIDTNFASGVNVLFGDDPIILEKIFTVLNVPIFITKDDVVAPRYSIYPDELLGGHSIVMKTEKDSLTCFDFSCPNSDSRMIIEFEKDNILTWKFTGQFVLTKRSTRKVDPTTAQLLNRENQSFVKAVVQELKALYEDDVERPDIIFMSFPEYKVNPLELIELLSTLELSKDLGIQFLILTNCYSVMKLCDLYSEDGLYPNYQVMNFHFNQDKVMVCESAYRVHLLQSKISISELLMALYSADVAQSLGQKKSIETLMEFLNPESRGDES